MEVRVLGPVEVLVDGRPVALPAKPRALLVLLALRRRVVPVDELIDELWLDHPPETAGKALQVYVSQLRKALGADRVETRAPGYALRLEEGELDLDRFEALVRDGRFGEALDLWRGPALAEFLAEPWAREAAAQLEDKRLGALEERIDADLDAGHGDLIPELKQLVAEHPTRERLAGQLMLAHYRAGRQAEALDVYRQTRGFLSDRLGIEPGPELRDLERAILQQDPALRHARPTPATDPRRRSRGPVIAIGAIAAAVVVVLLSLALTRGGSNDDPELRAFVTKVENFLAQSGEGRRGVVATIAAESKCKTTPKAAAAELDRVQRNRQSLLEQIAALSVPGTDEAQRAADLLQQSVNASIVADWHYRDWLLGLKKCGPPGRSRDLQQALASDGRASRAKKAFVATFNPIALRYGMKAWSDWEF